MIALCFTFDVTRVIAIFNKNKHFGLYITERQQISLNILVFFSIVVALELMRELIYEIICWEISN
jgi:hypothetical protein